MSLFHPAEQIQKIDAAAENAATEAEREKPPLLSFLEDETTGCCGQVLILKAEKIRCIYALYQQQGDAKRTSYISESGIRSGGHSYTFMDGSRGFADYNGKGILLRHYGHDWKCGLTWAAVDKRVRPACGNGYT